MLLGDARHLPIKDQRVQCVVTSPPYWGLRDYHVAGQLGLEPTPEEYVANLVEVFREVWRVLRDDGTVWLNLGDSYAGSWGNSGRRPELDNGAGGQREKNCKYFHRGGWDERRERPPSSYALDGLKPKDLVGIPWRVAFALQADGWYLRSDIIWAKPNPMPESVTDRPTKAHEYVFLFTKQERYYYDVEAVKEPLQTPPHAPGNKKLDGLGYSSGANITEKGRVWGASGKRNRRTVWKADADVWELATQPYKGAHFATFPERLVEPCVLAGSKTGDTVLDPFAGSGTVGVVCARLGRKFVGLELNSEYITLAQERIAKVSGGAV